MSENSTTELITTFFEALNTHDTGALLSLVTEDLIHDTRFGEREIGIEKFRWSVGLNAKYFHERVEDIVILVARGGSKAAAEVTLSGTYIATREGFTEARSQHYSISAGMFFEIDDGKISRITTYVDRNSWRTALIQSS